MRFLHTSDLHIGKRLNGIDLLSDQKQVLSQIIDIAVAERCSAVIIAGDIYDKAAPAPEAMMTFESFLRRLADAGILVFAVSGNHDNARRLAYMSDFARDKGIYITNGSVPETIMLNDEFGKIAVHLLPFTNPHIVRERCPEAELGSSYEAAVQYIIDECKVDESVRNIAVAHQFVTGAQTCNSEVFSIGGQDNISAALFDRFDYTALGHIHGPQSMKEGKVRYSGSPLKYSLSEANHKKSVTIVDMREKGDTELKLVPLTMPHDVREVRGGLAEILEMPYSEDLVRVVVTDEEVSPDARVTAGMVFPNMIGFMVDNLRTGGQFDDIQAESIENKTSLGLFKEFYAMMNNSVEPSDEQTAFVRGILERISGAEQGGTE